MTAKSIAEIKRILISGASRGIGQATALKLAREGRTLFLHGRNLTKLDEVAKEVRGKGAEAVTVTGDLKSPADIQKIVDGCGEGVDALINNAGISTIGTVEEMPLAEWNDMFAVNVTAIFLLSKLLLPKIPSGGAIVNISSGAGKVTFPNFSAYCATKFALEGFSRCLREEVMPRNIRVINVYPGSTDTDIWETIDGKWPREAMLRPEQVGEAVAFALDRPTEVLVNEIMINRTSGPVSPE